MKKLIFFLLLVFMVNLTFAQTSKYTQTFKKFQTNYNAGNYKKIVDLFSKGMKQHLPPEKAKIFFSGLKKQAGKIEHKKFIEFRNKTWATYETTFEKATMLLFLSVDQQNKITGLLIKPYIKQSPNHITNALTGFPEKLSTPIFAYTNIFPDKTQLSIAIIHNGKPEYYGILKEKNILKSIRNENKIFEIGSITKVFTATILAHLVNLNELQLDENINHFYPFTFNDSTKITFRNLASHTSGLPRMPANFYPADPANPYKDYGTKKLYDYLKNSLQLKHNPGSHYLYSNVGFGLLGYTLGLSQKTNIQMLTSKYIFDKYNMKSTYLSSKNLQEQLVKGLDKEGDVVSNWDFSVLFGAGGALSSAKDLAAFVLAQFDPDNKDLALTRKPTFRINNNSQMGLGWRIIRTKEGETLYWKNGGTGGYSSSVIFDVDTKTGVVILSNVSAFNPDHTNIDHLSFELMRRINQ